MAAKILLVCASVLFIQSIAAYACGNKPCSGGFDYGNSPTYGDRSGCGCFGYGDKPKTGGFGCSDKCSNGCFGGSGGFGYGGRLGSGGFGYGDKFGSGACCGMGGAGIRSGILNPACLSASRGPGLLVTSKSPMAPTGISICSENCIEGCLCVTGSMPFVASVGLDGSLPSGGCGTVDYNCGDGSIGINSEDYSAGASCGAGRNHGSSCGCRPSCSPSCSSAGGSYGGRF